MSHIVNYENYTAVLGNSEIYKNTEKLKITIGRINDLCGVALSIGTSSLEMELFAYRTVVFAASKLSQELMLRCPGFFLSAGTKRNAFISHRIRDFSNGTILCSFH